MRGSWAVPLVLALTSTAFADMVDVPRRDNSGDTVFWKEAIEPHIVEVDRLLQLARDSINRPDDSGDDTEWAIEERRKYYDDAYHIAAFAHRLSPKNADALAVLGSAADELGKVSEAKGYLEQHVTSVGLEKADIDALMHLGGIYLRLHQLDDAIQVLRYSQSQRSSRSVYDYGSGARSQTAATVYLSEALSEAGRSADALDVLVEATPSTVYYYSSNGTLTVFALATLYDKLEMRGAAYEQLERLRGMLNQGGSPGMYVRYVGDEINKMDFYPPEEREYFRGLLYESVGKYVEARAEWASYALVPDAAWRARALDHITAIDTHDRAPVEPPPPPPPGTVNPLVIP